MLGGLGGLLLGGLGRLSFRGQGHPAPGTHPGALPTTLAACTGPGACPHHTHTHKHTRTHTHNTTQHNRTQVMPSLLSHRAFKTPATRRLVEPGYRDAPELGRPMAVVFCKARGRG